MLCRSKAPLGLVSKLTSQRYPIPGKCRHRYRLADLLKSAVYPALVFRSILAPLKKKQKSYLSTFSCGTFMAENITAPLICFLIVFTFLPAFCGCSSKFTSVPEIIKVTSPTVMVSTFFTDFLAGHSPLPEAILK